MSDVVVAGYTFITNWYRDSEKPLYCCYDVNVCVLIEKEFAQTQKYI